MQRKIVIDFNIPDDPQRVSDQGLIHRMLILWEDIDRELTRNGQAISQGPQIDTVRPSISFTLSSNRDTGSVLAFIEKKLVRHKLAEIACISKFESK